MQRRPKLETPKICVTILKEGEDEKARVELEKWFDDNFSTVVMSNGRQMKDSITYEWVVPEPAATRGDNRNSPPALLIHHLSGL